MSFESSGIPPSNAASADALSSAGTARMQDPNSLLTMQEEQQHVGMVFDNPLLRPSFGVPESPSRPDFLDLPEQDVPIEIPPYPETTWTVLESEPTSASVQTTQLAENYIDSGQPEFDAPQTSDEDQWNSFMFSDSLRYNFDTNTMQVLTERPETGELAWMNIEDASPEAAQSAHQELQQILSANAPIRPADDPPVFDDEPSLPMDDINMTPANDVLPPWERE